jgi:MarR family transcriptional regulator, organic hydroperoxide resistance regulator
MVKVADGPVPLDGQLCYAVYSAGMAIQRLYKPLLDQLGLTYPQYLVLNVLWASDHQTVGGIAEELSLESSTLTPLLKRLETAGLVTRTRNPENERQVVIGLTAEGRGLRSRAGCLGSALLVASGESPSELGELNARMRHLGDALYGHIEARSGG